VETSVSTPEKLGPFELGREIGQGSYGIVYEALDPAREIRAAVKHFVHAPPGAATALSRLRRDAQAAGALGHPNVASVIAAGEQDGVSWVATELVNGVSFAQIARSRAPWPIERVLDVWRQMCEGLAHAHREGLLHLDLKPSDVRVNADGDVKILDFGAWRLKSLEGQQRVFVDAGLRYRPPEVLSGHRPDGRADIFAVAAIVYELVARRRAFPGESTTDVIRSVSRCEPDLATLPSSAFSPGFERMLAASLAREASRRPRSFEEVHADLVQLVRDTAPRLREAAPTTSGARPDRDALLAELTRARAEDRLEDALDVCRRLLALDPEDEAARRAFPEVESVLVTREADALVGEALTLAADGNIEAATRIAEKVEGLAPWSPRYLQLQVYLDEEGARRLAERHVETARGHMADGRTAEAGAAAQEALSALPGHEAAERLLQELGAGPATDPTAAEGAPRPAPAARPSLEPEPPAPAESSGSLAKESRAAAWEPAHTPAAANVSSEPAAGPAEPPPLVSGGELASAPEALGPAASPPAPRLDDPQPPPGVRVSASRRVEAEALTADALRHFMANEHDQARKVVDRALHLDPVNRRARELQRILRVLG